MKTLSLNQFTGTENYYRHHLGIVYTDGVKYLAQTAKAYWLIDAIASWQIDPKVNQDPMLQEIQFWKLQVNSDHSAVLSCERDTNDMVITQDILYTDFPLKSIKLYVNDGVLMLPSEY